MMENDVTELRRLVQEASRDENHNHHDQLTTATNNDEAAGGENVKGHHDQPSVVEKESSGTGSGRLEIEVVNLPSSNKLTQSLPPLLNPDILDHLFKFLIPDWIQGATAKDLHSLRLVCRTWSEAATRNCRQRLTGSFKCFWLADRETERYDMFHEKMNGFLDTMRDSQMIPYNSYKLIWYFFDNPKCFELFQGFLATCGPQMVSLGIMLRRMSTSFPDYYRIPRELPDFDLGTLKKLSFDYEISSATSRVRCIARYYGALLKAATSLKHLTLKLTHDDCEVELAPYIEIFQSLAFPNVPKSLEVLELHISLVGATVQHLKANGIKLKAFICTVDMRTEESESEAFCRLLESQGSTLEVLRIHSPCIAEGSAPLKLELPCLGQLRVLEAKLLELVVTPFCFRETLPSLERVDLSEWADEEGLAKILSFGKKEPARTVKALHIMANSQWLKEVSICFPNLVQLYLGRKEVSVETVQTLFRHFPNIEELFLELDWNKVRHDLDSVFSGFPEGKVNEIKRRGNFEDQDLDDLEEFRTQPSILNMHRLKKLMFFDGCEPQDQHVNQQGFNAFSDFSVVFTFLRMPNLKELALLQFEDQISSQYIHQLRKRAKLTFAVLGELEYYFEDGDNCRWGGPYNYPYHNFNPI